MDDKLVKDLKTGCTVWGLKEAKAIRELQKEHPEWVDIISDIEELEHILDTKFDGTKQLPYFGARLTKEGVRNLDRILTR